MLTSERTYRSMKLRSLVFEAKVAGGSLLVCSIDLRNDLDHRPVARQMLHSLTEYMHGAAFHPSRSLDVALIKRLLLPPPRLKKAIDGDLSTLWHTQWQGAVPSYPHEIQIDLQKAAEGTVHPLRGDGRI